MSEGRRPDIDLEMIGIPVGARLTFKGREDEFCVVVENVSPCLVVYGEKVYKLTTAARKVLGLDSGQIVQTSHLWLYKGETLWDRRMRFECWHCTAGGERKDVDDRSKLEA